MRKLNHLYLKAVSNVLLIYFSALVLGFLVMYFSGIEFVKDINQIHHNYISFETFRDIFFNNFKVYILLLIGIFLLKIPTIINLIINGGVFGFYLGGLHQDFEHVLLPLLIHGIPEILGFFIAAYIAFLGKEKFCMQKKFNICLLLFGAFLIFIAAVIETFISPLFI
ncbi:stage II sporulation protein M [Bacillus toyonensis]|uniref:stage II sporulation protein M n=1 Tax=Bacillus toyonensis TaxID=155322 RepID=UPI000CD8B518|nr:stage II sporulation protein M [Bacillus toyonensis]MED3542096.1 stage II sporulation protein M [Bacillus toyonensis]MEE2022347.1 stage II sporulation protein M [Bacillus toyonensis]